MLTWRGIRSEVFPINEASGLILPGDMAPAPLLGNEKDEPIPF